MSENLILSLSGGAFAILGVVVGGLLSFLLNLKVDKRQALRRSYADIFETYMRFVPSRTEDNFYVLLAAIEKTRLICSDDSGDFLGKMEQSLKNYENDPHTCGILLAQLREIAKQEIKNA